MFEQIIIGILTLNIDITRNTSMLETIKHIFEMENLENHTNGDVICFTFDPIK